MQIIASITPYTNQEIGIEIECQKPELAFLPHMATSSTFAFPKKINRHKLSTLSLLLLFIFCIFLFNRRALEPKLFIYRDLISQTPAPLLLSPPRSTEFHEKFGDLRQPVSSLYNPDENVNGNVTVSSELSEPEFQEDSNEETTVHISSKSDLDDKTAQNTTELFISSEPGSLDNFGEGIDEPVSSNEETIVPISSKSDLDDKTWGKPEYIDVKEKSFEEAASSDTETGSVIDNAIAEKLRNCDVYKGTWVKDEGYPLYRPGSCPYVDEAFDCQSNGRPDSGYTQWRWKPDECDLPRFSTVHFVF